MNDIDSETLMAYADGELDPVRRKEVEALLERDPEARAMVRKFRESTDLLKGGLDTVLEQPIPQRLIDAIGATAPSSDSNIVELPIPPARPRRTFWPGLAAAASLVVAVGLVGSILLLDRAGPPGTDGAATQALQQALERLPSGTVLETDDGMRVTPVLTFRASDGRVCREFERETPGSHTIGVACRDEEERWVAEVEVERDTTPDGNAEDVYLPAGGAQDPISELLDRLGAGAALSAEEESRLRETGWSR
jgi:hypothetical protein